MNHSISAITGALLLLSVSHVSAASSVDLSVKGVITPSACVPALSQGGVADNGKVSIQDLTWGRATPLPGITLQLSVNCEASTLFAIKSHDNRQGSSAEFGAGPSSFGLGLVNGDTKIGWYTLKMNNSLADGVSRLVIESIDGQTWLSAPEGTQVWQPNWMRTFNSAGSLDATPLPMQTLETDLLIETWIAAKRYLPVGQEVPMDGSATLDIVYL